MISRTYQNPPCSKPWAIAQGFCWKRSISDPWEFTPNRYKWSRKGLKIYLEGFRRRFREFGAISRTYQNPPFSKPWALAQAYCWKSANFRPLRIHPKSTQTVKELEIPENLEELEIYSPGFLLKNGHLDSPGSLEELGGSSRLFREFGAISRTYQNPPCSKPWAIAQAFCSKTASRPSRIPKSTQTPANSPEIDTNMSWAIAHGFCWKRELYKSI